jgi:hypothetical protein
MPLGTLTTAATPTTAAAPNAAGATQEEEGAAAAATASSPRAVPPPNVAVEGQAAETRPTEVEGGGGGGGGLGLEVVAAAGLEPTSFLEDSDQHHRVSPASTLGGPTERVPPKGRGKGPTLKGGNLGLFPPPLQEGESANHHDGNRTVAEKASQFASLQAAASRSGII